MKKLLWMPVFIGLILVSCASVPGSRLSGPRPRVDHSFPQTGTSNNAAIVVKDYETLGIIFVKSSVTIAGNRTGSKITYEMLMLEAQKLGADDIINIRIDVNEKVDFDSSGNPIRTTLNYTANALAIKYTTAVPIAANTSQYIANRMNVSSIETRTHVRDQKRNIAANNTESHTQTEVQQESVTVNETEAPAQTRPQNVMPIRRR